MLLFYHVPLMFSRTATFVFGRNRQLTVAFFILPFLDNAFFKADHGGQLSLLDLALSSISEISAFVLFTEHLPFGDAEYVKCESDRRNCILRQYPP